MEAPLSAGDQFIVEDLFDFSNEDNVIADGTFDSSVATDSYNSPPFSVCETNFGTDIGCQSFIDDHFAGELPVPYDDLTELEWMSNFMEESFSCEEMQKLQLISGLKTRPEKSLQTTHAVDSKQIIDDDEDNDNPIFNADMAVPAKARSKRSRIASANWASHLLVLNSTTQCSEPNIVVPVQPVKTKRKDGIKGGGGVAANPNGRRCLHCATDKTPQWRTGPMGPKTLCNACGVRYKSGRLVPEYRPAASPTFVLTKHSNSHRKVLELRRQQEMVRSQQEHHHQPFIRHHNHHQNMVFDASDSDDYLIHQYVGPDFRQLS